MVDNNLSHAALCIASAEATTRVRSPYAWRYMSHSLYPGAFGVALVEDMREAYRVAVAIEDAELVFHPTMFSMKAPGQLMLCIMFQRPYEGRSVDCITTTGAGALNIDAARIPLSGDIDSRMGGNGAWSTKQAGQKVYEGGWGKSADVVSSSNEGRWPANFLLYKDAEEGLNEQGGVLTSGKPGNYRKPTSDNQVYQTRLRNVGDPMIGYGDSGRLSRFCQVVESDAELMEYVARLMLPPAEYAPRRLLVMMEKDVDKTTVENAVHEAGWELVINAPYEESAL